MGNIFKAIGSFFKKVSQSDLGQAAEQIYVDKLGALFLGALESANEKDPQLAQDITATLSRWAPYLAEAAAKTGTDIDDKVVAELQEQIAIFIGEHTGDTGGGGDTTNG